MTNSQYAASVAFVYWLFALAVCLLSKGYMRFNLRKLKKNALKKKCMKSFDDKFSLPTMDIYNQIKFQICLLKLGGILIYFVTLE